MYKLTSVITMSAVSALALAVFAGAAQGQTYGTDYVSFEGTLVVLDNPTSTACQNDGVIYNESYRVSYRFTANPSVIQDAIALFPSGDNAERFRSTQTSGSLSGQSTTEYTYINHYANESSSAAASSSNLTILSGLGQPVSLGTGNIKILGSINNFLGYSDCNVSSVHAALVAIPQ